MVKLKKTVTHLLPGAINQPSQTIYLLIQQPQCCIKYKIETNINKFRLKPTKKCWAKPKIVMIKRGEERGVARKPEPALVNIKIFQKRDLEC